MQRNVWCAESTRSGSSCFEQTSCLVLSCFHKFLFRCLGFDNPNLLFVHHGSLLNQLQSNSKLVAFLRICWIQNSAFFFPEIFSCCKCVLPRDCNISLSWAVADWYLQNFCKILCFWHTGCVQYLLQKVQIRVQGRLRLATQWLFCFICSRHSPGLHFLDILWASSDLSINHWCILRFIRSVCLCFHHLSRTHRGLAAALLLSFPLCITLRSPGLQKFMEWGRRQFTGCSGHVSVSLASQVLKCNLPHRSCGWMKIDRRILNQTLPTWITQLHCQRHVCPFIKFKRGTNV